MQLDVFKRAIKMFILGDCIGVPYEFPRKVTILESDNKELMPRYLRRSGGRYFPAQMEYTGGTYSDDSQLLLSVLRCVKCHDDWYSRLRDIELPSYLSYNQGAGNALRVACSSFERGLNPWDTDTKKFFEAGGNGSAMRVLSHMLDSNKPIEMILKEVQADTLLTHGHPIAVIGSKLYIYACYIVDTYGVTDTKTLIMHLIEDLEIWGILCDDGYTSKYVLDVCAETYDKYREEVKTMLLDLYSTDIDSMNYKDVLNKCGAIGSFKGSALACTLSCIALMSRYINNIEKAGYEVGRCKDVDTDTLLGMLYGMLGIVSPCVDAFIEKYWGNVDDNLYVDKLLSTERGVSLHNVPPKAVKPSKIKDKIKELKLGESIETSVFGIVTKVEETDNKSLIDSIHYSMIVCETEEGQTLLIPNIKKLGKE